MQKKYNIYSSTVKSKDFLKFFIKGDINIATCRKNLLAIKASGETSFWWHVGHVCSSDSKSAVLIPMYKILNINKSTVRNPVFGNELRRWFICVQLHYYFPSTHY